MGTHTGDGQLPSRLRQHFIVENKDRSIFRKNIGRAFLNADNAPYLRVWELDLTTSLCQNCRPSANWLGLKSPKKKIRESGLWLANELYKESLSTVEL